MQRTRGRVNHPALAWQLPCPKRVQRRSGEGQSGWSVQPVGQKVQVAHRNEVGRCDGRQAGSNHQRCRGHGGTHPARRTGTAIDLAECVQRVRCGLILRAAMGAGRGRISSGAGAVRVMLAHAMHRQCGGWCDRQRQPAVVVWTAIDHGCRRKPLHGQREQQKPQQCRAQLATHADSAKRIARV